MCKWTLALIVVTLLAEGSDSTAANVAFVSNTDTCTPAHQQRVLEAVLGCQPRPTVVELSYPDDAVTGSNSIEQVIPGHLLVNRCSGSCHEGIAHSCIATLKENITVEVMGLQATYRPGRRNKLCTTITVEQDVECMCGCNVKPSDCAQNQFYDAASCKCRCADQTARARCLQAGRMWDADSCSCVCPRRTWRACSTGYTFDYTDTCRCKPIVVLGGSASLIALVAVAVVFWVALGAVVFHLKRLKERDERRDEARQKLRNEFEDAFNAELS